MIGNNSCGASAQAYGKTVDNVRRLEVLTYDGTRMWVGPTSGPSGRGSPPRAAAAPSCTTDWTGSSPSTSPTSGTATRRSRAVCPATTSTSLLSENGF